MKKIIFNISDDFILRKEDSIILDKEQFSTLLHNLSETNFSLPEEMSITTEQDTSLGVFTVKVSSPYYINVPLISTKVTVSRGEKSIENFTPPRKILQLIAQKLQQTGLSDESYQLFYFPPGGEFRLTFRSS